MDRQGVRKRRNDVLTANKRAGALPNIIICTRNTGHNLIKEEEVSEEIKKNLLSAIFLYLSPESMDFCKRICL